ncbi:MAG TPA: Hpt domain-containing protein, partial [Gemmatimonadaceae bacterium]|nr:Hpt domain-containing protein [Gemmatimonadaceae bacterium]
MNAQRYADLFRAEARERLTEMNNALLAIERGAGAERITELFRAVHNMKGMSAAMGYQSIRDLSHGLETLLEKLRRDQSTPSPAVIDVLFEAVDLLESGVVLVSANPDAAQDVTDMVLALEALAAAASLEDIPTLTPTMEWPIPSAGEPTPQQTRRFTPARSARLTPSRQARFTPPLGTRTASFPIVEGKRSVRVDAERLDTLMTLVGELVIARGRLTDLSRKANNVEL